jgi:hypothetical protein
MVRARSSTIALPEVFDLYRAADGSFELRSKASGSYISAELQYAVNGDGVDEKAMLRARAGSAGSYEAFTLS